MKTTTSKDPLVETPIVCMSCGQTAKWFGRIASTMSCPSCGSDDLDLLDKQASGQGFHTWITQGHWPEGHEDEDEEDDGEVHLPPHLQPHYDAGYRHGRAGGPSAYPYNDGREHTQAYFLGLEHGDRDRGYDQRRQASSPGTGWTKSRPDQAANWDEYAGPTPSANPKAQTKNDADATGTCPVCHGTGTNPLFTGGGYAENVCRNCHGTGKITYTTGQPQTQSLDAHKPGPVPLGGGWQGKAASAEKIDIEASCPTDDSPYTSLIRDRQGNAWWHCASCGPLANLDANPYIDPREPGGHFRPDRSMKTVGKVFNRRQGYDGKLFSMTAAVIENNPGLSSLQALDLARRALLAFPEEQS